MSAPISALPRQRVLAASIAFLSTGGQVYALRLECGHTAYQPLRQNSVIHKLATCLRCRDIVRNAIGRATPPNGPAERRIAAGGPALTVAREAMALERKST